MTQSTTWITPHLLYSEQNDAQASETFIPERLTPKNVTTYPRRKKKVTNLLEQKLIKLQSAREVVLSKSARQARELLFYYLSTRGNNIINLNSSVLEEEKEIWESKGISIRHITQYDSKALEKNIDEKTSLIYLETLNQHTLDITSLLKIYVIAREHRLPIIADNSNGHLGALIRPTNYGINFVVEEASSLWNNHDDEFTTVISEGQPFEWSKVRHPRLAEAFKKVKAKHPRRTQEDTSLIEIFLDEKTEEVKEISAELSAIAHEKIDRLQKQVSEYSRHTLHLAEYLYQLQFIRFVHYAGLKTNSNHFSALTYLRNGFGNELAFETTSSELDKAVQEIFENHNQHLFNYRYNPSNQWHHLRIKGAHAQQLLDLFHQVSERWVENSKKNGLLPWNLDYSI